MTAPKQPNWPSKQPHKPSGPDRTTNPPGPGKTPPPAPKPAPKPFPGPQPKKK